MHVKVISETDIHNISFDISVEQQISFDQTLVLGNVYIPAFVDPTGKYHASKNLIRYLSDKGVLSQEQLQDVMPLEVPLRTNVAIDKKPNVTKIPSLEFSTTIFNKVVSACMSEQGYYVPMLDVPATWLSMFRFYDSYEAFIGLVASDPDAGTEIVEETEITANGSKSTLSEATLNTCIRPERNERYYEEDIRAFCHLIIICSMKNISRDTDQQYENLMKRRLEVLGNTLNVVGIKNMGYKEFFLGLSQYLSLRPKLRRYIWMFCKWEAQNAEMSSAATLTKYSGMAQIKCVDEFIGGKIKVPAQRDPRLFPEMKAYHEAKEVIISRLGKDNFGYLRYFEPTNQTLAASLYPNLFAAAYYYCGAHFSPTIQRLISKPGKETIPNLLINSIRQDKDAQKFYTQLEHETKKLEDPAMKAFITNTLGLKADETLKANVDDDITTNDLALLQPIQPQQTATPSPFLQSLASRYAGR